MKNNQTSRYTYLEAGFNRFFSRAINSNADSATLQQVSNTAGSRTINFDLYQASGNLGDKIQVGGITIDGTNRRIVIIDEGNNEVGWIGNISSV